MTAQLRLTGFRESSDDEPRLLLQVQWKDLRLPLPPTLMASSLFRIPYHYPSRLPPSRLDLKRYFIAAEFSPCIIRYLEQKIASFVLDLASAFSRVSPPSLYIFAEIEMQPLDDFYGRLPECQTRPLMPRRLHPPHQPRGVPLLSRLFIDNAWVGDFMGVRRMEDEDSQDQNRTGASLQAITKLRELKLEKELIEIQECSVCLQEMSAIKEVLATPCDHVFHAKCIAHWLKRNNSCPLCRSKLHY